MILDAQNGTADSRFLNLNSSAADGRMQVPPLQKLLKLGMTPKELEYS